MDKSCDGDSPPVGTFHKSCPGKTGGVGKSIASATARSISNSSSVSHWSWLMHATHAARSFFLESRSGPAKLFKGGIEGLGAERFMARLFFVGIEEPRPF